MATIQGFTKDKVISELATKLSATVTSPQDNQVISYDAATSKWINTELVLPDIPTSSFKDAVKAATTANITLSAPQTIDGIVLVAGDRVLVKNQTAGAENGIYIVQAAAWTRATDANSTTDIANAIVPVDSGTANGGLIFHTTIKITDTLGTTSMSWYRVIDTSYVIPATQGGTGQTSYAVGDLLYAPTTTTVGRIADLATGNALISGGVGVAPSYGKIGLTTHVSGTLPLANGGTNGTSAAVNGGVVYSNATAMVITAAGTQDQVLKSNGAGAPTWQTLDLTYMPDAAYKKSVKAATTANITLSAPQTIDGIALVAGDRVLVKNQTAGAENGIYIVQAAGWTRATDADTISEVAGATVNVDSGTQGSQLWSNNLKTTDTLGTTAMVWTRLINNGDVGSVVQGYNATLAAVAGGTYTGDDSITTVGTIGAGTWQGTDVGLAYGGTNATLTAVNGGAVYSTATGLAITTAGTAGQVLRSNGAAAPTWQTDNLDSMSDVVITSPTAGQTLAYNGMNWINGSGGGGGVTASATAPVSPVNGSAWFDTNDGTLYVYYTDANGSQWVEVQADSALGSQLATRMSTAETNITALQAVSPNYLLNADFCINQRAFTSSTTNGGYGFDRWHMAALSGATYSAQTFTPGVAPVAGYEAKNYARIVTTGQTGTNMYTILRQCIEDVRLLAGKTVTVSFWAKAASGTPKVAVEFEQAFGGGGSPSAAVTTAAGQVTLSTSWARYSVTVNVPSIAGKTIGTNENSSLTYLSLFVSAGTDYNARTGSLGIQSNTFDFWGVQVEQGSMATPFRRNANSIQGELAACQRYYFRITAGNLYGHIAAGVANSSNIAAIQLKHPVTMRTIPTTIDTSGTGIWDSVSFYTVNSLVFQSGHTSTDISFLNATVAANPLTQFRPYFLIGGNNVGSYVGVGAEL